MTPVIREPQTEMPPSVMAMISPGLSPKKSQFLDDVEGAGADDAGGDGDEGEGVEVVFVDAGGAGDAHGDLDADEDADRGEEAVPGGAGSRRWW